MLGAFARAEPLPVLRVLGADAGPDVLHHRDLGRAAARLRGDQVLPLHDGRLAADAGGDPGRLLLHFSSSSAPLSFDLVRRRGEQRAGAARHAASRSRARPSGGRRSRGCSRRSRWPSPSRCRWSRSTPGCPTRTSRRRRRARWCSPACCSRWAPTASCASRCRCSRSPPSRLAPVIFGLALVGILYGALVAMVQDDIKKLVAYSSVAHLGFVMLGIFALNVAGSRRRGPADGEPRALDRRALPARRHALRAAPHPRDRRRSAASRSRCRCSPRCFGIVAMSSIGLPGLNGFVGEFLILLGVVPGEPVGRRDRRPSAWCSPRSTCSGCTGACSSGPSRSPRTAA